MFGGGPRCEVGSAFTHQLERQRRSQPVYLSEIDPKHGMQRRPHIEVRLVRLLCRMPGGRQLALLLEHLAQRLDLLSAGPTDFTPRQQSMRGALEWSYELLDDDERHL